MKTKFEKAKTIALKYSRGHVPQRQCSPYGHLQNDPDQIKEDMRLIYEALLECANPVTRPARAGDQS